MKKLILTVGLPRSGKSTWAKKTGFPVVNPDSIRLVLHGETFIQSFEPAVWTLARQMVEALFVSGHNTVILDATNISRKNRDEWDDTKKWVTYIKWVKTTKKVCINRAISGFREDLVPVIERMADNFEAPDYTRERICK